MGRRILIQLGVTRDWRLGHLGALVPYPLFVSKVRCPLLLQENTSCKFA